MVHVLDHAVVAGAADGDGIERGQVLHVLAQSDAARVRTDRDLEFRREQQDRQAFVHTGDAAGVELAHIHGSGLQELFEQDRVGAVLAGGHPDRRDGLGNRRVAENIIRAGGVPTHQRSNGLSSVTHSMACGTSQTWLASTINRRSGPITDRASANRR